MRHNYDRSVLIHTAEQMQESGPDDLNGVEQYFGCNYREIADDLNEYDWYGWYPAVVDGVLVGILPADMETPGWKLNWSLDVMIPDDDDRRLYILRDLDNYGSSHPVCVTVDEAVRLMRAWYGNADDQPDFSDVWREADDSDIAMYGVDED